MAFVHACCGSWLIVTQCGILFQLPFKVDIIKHPCEVDGKSTAVHAALLAPHDVTVYHFPHIPDYTNARKVIFIFLHLILHSFQLCSLRRCRLTVGLAYDCYLKGKALTASETLTFLSSQSCSQTKSPEDSQ